MATKQELEVELKALKKRNVELENQVHELSNDLSVSRSHVQSAEEEKKYLAEAVKQKDSEISELRKSKSSDMIEHNTIEESKRNLASENEILKSDNTQLKQRVEQLEAIELRRVNELNTYIFVHGALMKTFQGALETASLLNEKITKEVEKE